MPYIGSRNWRSRVSQVSPNNPSNGCIMRMSFPRCLQTSYKIVVKKS
jgi:hypothetical protein